MSSGSSQTQTTEPWSAAQPTLRRGMNLLNNTVDRDPSGRSSIAGFDARQVESHRDLLSYGRNDKALADTRGVRSSAMDIVNGGGQNDAIFNAVQSRINPAVSAQFGLSGRVGSGAHQDTLTRALTEAYAPQASSNYFQAANMVPGLDAAVNQDALQRAQVIGSVGDARQNMTQRYKDAPYMQADRLLRAGGQIGGLGGTSSSSTSGGGLSNALQILGLGTGLFSDRRVKENIRKIGETHGGQAIYTYNYVGDMRTHMGVMADETPDHAVSHVGGVAMVDYSKVA